MKEFKDVRVDFKAVEQRLALFGRSDVIPNLYFPKSERDRTREIDKTAIQLASLCICLKEFPFIRYHESSSSLCEAIAARFDAQLKLAARESPDWTCNEVRGTLLILDRTLDPISPLMHEFTYQAMFNDVLKTDGSLVSLHKATATSEDSKGPFVLDEDDDMFVEMRHLHIADVTQRVTAKFNEFKSKNATAKLQGTSDIKEMIAVARSLPEYRAEMKKYTKHIAIAEACLDFFDDRNLKEVSQLEQDMATGIDENGYKTTKKNVQERLVQIMEKPGIHLMDKLRLLMIYIISQDGIDVATRKHLFGIAEFSEVNETACQNLVHLGVTLQSVREMHVILWY
jgi:hypothetical protein